MIGKIFRKIYKSILSQNRLWRFIIKTYPFVWEVCMYIVVQKPFVLLSGPLFERSRTKIEIDITYYCNLRCFNCDRLCRQAPSGEHMSIEQIKKFIRESIENNIKWERIRIVGGEPTLHPDIFEIVQMLLDYKKAYIPNCEVMLVTNGYGEKVNNVLSVLPKELIIENTEKKDPHQHFVAINMAPRDLKLYRLAEYSRGCGRICNCGIGLTPFGYYPCAIAGSIDRVLGFDAGREKLPSEDDSMVDQLKLFCQYCGHFIDRMADKEVMTSTWIEAYKQYRINKPLLSKY